MFQNWIYMRSIDFVGLLFTWFWNGFVAIITHRIGITPKRFEKSDTFVMHSIRFAIRFRLSPHWTRERDELQNWRFIDEKVYSFFCFISMNPCDFTLLPFPIQSFCLFPHVETNGAVCAYLQFVKSFGIVQLLPIPLNYCAGSNKLFFPSIVHCTR